jgi:hypothetical protein
MKDKIFMILLGIIAVNLTIQTVKDVGIFPTAYAQNGVQKVAICSLSGIECADLSIKQILNGRMTWAVSVSDVSDSQ